ncbi:hypothetical protein N6H14_17455 [Paenibacillus sp. CC-CFT747]|nr:hypothetical protein N6H14_17455 [Paenibacillus sp. CC-CFT747]
MNKVFVEYRIDGEAREDYLQFMQSMGEGARFELYEGSDQPNLFVELWSGLDKESYLRLKEERLNDETGPWAKLNGMVSGGKDKVHIWHFQKVR